MDCSGIDSDIIVLDFHSLSLRRWSWSAVEYEGVDNVDRKSLEAVEVMSKQLGCCSLLQHHELHFAQSTVHHLGRRRSQPPPEHEIAQFAGKSIYNECHRGALHIRRAQVRK